MPNDSVIDHVIPDGQWQFDDSVAHVFDNMLSRSIPQYEVMRQACLDLAVHYRQPDSEIVDLGCSRGEALAPLIAKFGAENRFVGIDMSDPMLAACRERFADSIDLGVVDIRKEDLRTYAHPINTASVIMSVLTLQFTPIEYRQAIVKSIYQALRPNGAFIIVEKVLGGTSELNELMVKLYYALKTGNGYSQEQIERKRLSLEGVLVPITADWNEQLLGQTGFRQVDCFWRWMNFAGWVAIK